MIRKLRLQNFKCFEDQSFDFKPLTLLTGLNGTGKSSVIQSLLLLRQSYKANTSYFILRGDLVNIGTGLDALFEKAVQNIISISLDVELDFIEGMSEAYLSEYRFSNKKWVLSCDKYSDILKLLKPENESEKHVNNTMPSALFLDGYAQSYFHYLHAERLGPRLFFETSNSQVQEDRLLGLKGEYAVHFLGVHGDEQIPSQKLGHEKALSYSLRHQVEAWLGEISPGTRIALDQAATSSMDVIGIRYAFASDTDVTNYYRATNVGFGITYVLPVLVAVLSAGFGSLLIIENPEAHLHPKGQAQIGRLLARAAHGGVQIIVETHSDHVLNGIRLAVHDGQAKPDDVQLHFFRRREEDGQSEVISPKIDRDGRIDQWPDDFFDEWDKSLEELLMPRRGGEE